MHCEWENHDVEAESLKRPSWVCERNVGVPTAASVTSSVANSANGGALDYYLIGRLDDHEDKSGYERSLLQTIQTSKSFS